MSGVRQLCGVAAALWLGLGGAPAQQAIVPERATFPSLDGKTALQAFLLRPRGEGARAAVHELPAYRLPSGVIPLAGTEPMARADAIPRVIEFFQRHLLE